jgi:hypothetical protein
MAVSCRSIVLQRSSGKTVYEKNIHTGSMKICSVEILFSSYDRLLAPTLPPWWDGGALRCPGITKTGNFLTIAYM